jgi:hypothetical protein
MSRRPFDLATDVTVECPYCQQYKTVPRSANLPAEVRLIKIICPDCDDGDRHTETWFSAPGVEVSQDMDEEHGGTFDYFQCPTCHGRGTVNPLTAPADFFCVGTTDCPTCDGSGVF